MGLTVPAVAQVEADEAGSTAAIEIGLPPGEDRRVVVADNGDRITIDLPASARYPQDFIAASAGFLTEARDAPAEQGRRRLVLGIVRGVLDRVEYRPDGVTLFLTSRLQLTGRAGDVDEYRLGTGDKIRVAVHNQPDLTSSLLVQEGGTITAPLVGEVGAGGLTVRQLANRLAELLDRTYLVSPKVDVQVEEYRSQWAMVSGEVRTPGRVALRGGTNLKEVLGEAGGFTDDAGQKILISRRVNGGVEPSGIEIDRFHFESGAANPTLRHGDIVTVRRALFCYIQGEVKSPNRVAIEPGMTLLKAITIAGGLTEWANRKAIRVLREGEAGSAEFYNLKAIQSGKAPDPPLKGGEIIIVRRRSL